jgi:hypothetical protein
MDVLAADCAEPTTFLKRENFILTLPRFSEKRLRPRFGSATAFLLVFPYHG